MQAELPLLRFRTGYRTSQSPSYHGETILCSGNTDFIYAANPGPKTVRCPAPSGKTGTPAPILSRPGSQRSRCGRTNGGTAILTCRSAGDAFRSRKGCRIRLGLVQRERTQARPRHRVRRHRHCPGEDCGGNEGESRANIAGTLLTSRWWLVSLLSDPIRSVRVLLRHRGRLSAAFGHR